jgi:hypothetical protein
MLELGVLYNQQPQMAVDLAHRVVHEHLTVEALRVIIAKQIAGESPTADREERSNRRAGAASVRSVTSDANHDTSSRTDKAPIRLVPAESATLVDDMIVAVSPSQDERPASRFSHSPALDAISGVLAALASQADEISGDPATLQHVEIAEQALLRIRRAVVRRMLPSSVLSRSNLYRLLNAELSDLVLLLRQHHTALAMLRPALGKGQTLNLVLCRVPTDASIAGAPPQRNVLCITTPGRSSAVLPATTSDLGGWARHYLKLSQHEASMATALLHDLQEIFLED